MRECTTSCSTRRFTRRFFKRFAVGSTRIVKKGMKNKFSFLLCFFLLTFASNSFAKSYSASLRSATESKEWFSADDMKTNIVWRATYFSPTFRHAFIEEHIKRHYLDAVAAAPFTQEQEEDQAEYTEFFFGLYAKKPYRELSLSPSSFWQLVRSE